MGVAAIKAPMGGPLAHPRHGASREPHAPNAAPGAIDDRPAGQNAATTVTLAVENMNCGGCMRKIERTLDGVAGVSAARANLSAKRVTVVAAPGGPTADDVARILADAGFKAAEVLDTGEDERVRADRDLLRRLAVAGFAASNIMLLSVSVWAGVFSDMTHELQQAFHWLSALIALPAVAYAGQPFFRSAITALSAWRLNMDVPISLALILASAMSLFQTIEGGKQVYFDASVSLCFFLLIGRYLDHTLRARAKSAAQNLLGLKSSWATVRRADGATERLPTRALCPGMEVLVAAGERFAVDGEIIDGLTNIDEQLISGETVPRSAGPGDHVYAGTVSLTAPVTVRVRASEDDTLLAEIGRLMEAAEQNRGRYVRWADKAAGLYAPIVHTLGLATFIGWMLLGAPWDVALTTAIAVLIITCPCALALAVPAVQVAATGRLFARGVIMTAADGLERLAEVDTVVFDKTGTLTLGQPELVNSFAIDDATLADAATLAAGSRHPYAEAVVRAAKHRGLAVHAAGDTTEVAGRGMVRGPVGKGWDAASDLRSDLGADLDANDGRQALGAWDWVCGGQPMPTDDASSVLGYRDATGAVTAFMFTDTVRSDAAQVVGGLQRAGVRVELLSGDRMAAVQAAAAAAGIAEWHGEQKPHEKIARLAALKAAGARVLMVGDGLNDAPALAAAHASLSPSSAADISQIASDGIIQGEKLAPILETLAVAQRTRRLAFENFGIAALYNAICIPLAATGFVTPLVAAIAMSASSIIVTANASRLGFMPLKLRPVARRSSSTA